LHIGYPIEVAEVELHPAEDTRLLPKAEKTAAIDALEYSVYLATIERSKYYATLPPVIPRIELPSSNRFPLVPDDMREDREHPDVRIARRAETLTRVAAVAHERGEVSSGLRRVIVIQAVRFADLAAARLAYAESRSRPAPTAIDVQELVGGLMAEFGDEDPPGGSPDVELHESDSTKATDS
jgi:hypothetical protein